MSPQRATFIVLSRLRSEPAIHPTTSRYVAEIANTDDNWLATLTRVRRAAPACMRQWTQRADRTAATVAEWYTRFSSANQTSGGRVRP
eukprot:1959620-Prymnesium_polylepis.1